MTQESIARDHPIHTINAVNRVSACLLGVKLCWVAGNTV